MMIEKGKTAVLYALRDVRVEDMEVRQPYHDQALIKIKACGVCPTDVRSYMGMRKGSYPRTIGHEWVGEIIETGKDFPGFNIGDRIVPDWRVVCGKCYYCRFFGDKYEKYSNKPSFDRHLGFWICWQIYETQMLILHRFSRICCERTQIFEEAPK